MIIAILIFALLFILPDLYISSVLMRGAAWWAHLLLWLPAITALGLIASFRLGGVTSGKLDIFTALLLCVALPQILFTVFSLLGKLTSFAWQPALGIGNGTGIAVGAVVSVAMLYGLLFGWKQLTVRNIDLAFDDLPESFNGYRVVQLSDMHVGSYGTNPSFLEKVVQRVHDEQPDLIVFTGDLI
ncbi:MAG: hypothetical protein K5660_07375, partial [Paludibacteraceae bacterium]|nr:hypothetical protein [Paludibacteraceae bacterium]